MQYIVSDAVSVCTLPGHVSGQSNEQLDHPAEFEATVTLSVCCKNLVQENNLQLLACIQVQVSALWIITDHYSPHAKQVQICHTLFGLSVKTN